MTQKMNLQTVNSFKKFRESWLEQLHHQVEELRSALNHRPPAADTATATAASSSSSIGGGKELEALVDKVMGHYTEYYRMKWAAVDQDVLGVVAAPWASALERSLHWVAGWRPTTVFHLVYTESSILFESQIGDILRGLGTGDLGDLSPSQFRTVSELQCETVKEENAITNELSDWQDEAGHLIKGTSADVDEKIVRLAIIVHKADDLRLKTVNRVVELLTPLQAAEFLTAATELRFGVRGWGVSHDQKRGQRD